jgi:hypothetical protein
MSKETKRTIKAVYYNGHDKPLKITRGTHPRSMMWHAFDHMQVDDYGAKVVEVFDTVGAGTLHGVLKLSLVNGKIRIDTVYERNPTKYIEGGR